MFENINPIEAIQANQDAALAECSPQVQGRVAMLEELVRKLTDRALDDAETIQHLETLVSELGSGLSALAEKATSNNTI